MFEYTNANVIAPVPGIHHSDRKCKNRVYISTSNQAVLTFKVRVVLVGYCCTAGYSQYCSHHLLVRVTWICKM